MEEQAQTDLLMVPGDYRSELMIAGEVAKTISSKEVRLWDFCQFIQW